MTLRAIWAILWRAGAFLIVWGLLLAPLVVPLSSTLAEWEQAAPLKARLYADAVGAATILAATWLMTRFVDRRPFLDRPFFARVLSPRRLRREAPAGLAFGAGWLAVSVGVAWSQGWIAPQATAQVAVAVLLGAALATFLNVLTQQLLLCGYIFDVIRRQAGLCAAGSAEVGRRTAGAGAAGFGVAVGVSALLFSAYHLGAFKGAWLPALNVFLAGALFCLAFGLAGSLWLPIAIHFAWNFLLGPALGLTVSGSGRLGYGWSLLAVEGPDLWTGGKFGLEGGLVVTLTTAAGISAIALGWRRRALIDRTRS
jgi:hypothetical protein